MAKKIKTTPSSVQIIGGTFRSRKIIFFEEAGLRPTHGRIRETLFNWLAPNIENSICLDAFAGSGALGFEAISRGAKHVTFCDTSRRAISTLNDNATQLKIDNVNFLNINFISENAVLNEKFDLVFLDPPFKNNLLINACNALISKNLLNSEALIYFECAKNSVDFSQLNERLTIEKHKETHSIEYGLLLYRN